MGGGAFRRPVEFEFPPEFHGYSLGLAGRSRSSCRRVWAGWWWGRGVSVVCVSVWWGVRVVGCVLLCPSVAGCLLTARQVMGCHI
jgi:hypothetical protein